MLGDAKHTESTGNNICANDQAQLFNALVCVQDAISAMNEASTAEEQLALAAVRLVFVSNKMGLSSSDTTELHRAKAAAQAVFAGAFLEVLNKESFQFGAFSDILGARRAKKVPAAARRKR